MNPPLHPLPCACPTAPAGVAVRRFAGPPGSDRRHLRTAARRELHALARCLGGDGTWDDTPQGPRGTGAWNRLGLSLAYAGAQVLIGVAVDRRIGVDLVEVADLPEWRELARLYLGATTCATLERLPPAARPGAFADAWAGYEAELKALGLGLDEATGLPRGHRPSRHPLVLPDPLRGALSLSAW